MRDPVGSARNDAFVRGITEALARGGYTPAAWREFFVAAGRRSIVDVRACPMRTRSLLRWTVAIVGVAVAVLVMLGAGHTGPALPVITGAWLIWFGLWIGWLAAHIGLVAPPGSPHNGLLLPNGLSAARLLLAPLAGVALLSEGRPVVRGLLAAFVLLLALTDTADGRIARRWDQLSSLGAALDPLADMALICALAVGLSMRGLLPFALLIVVLVRYLAAVAGALALFLWRGPFTVRSTSWGRFAGGIAQAAS